MPSLADRLRAAHQDRFVGRDAELAAFGSALDAAVLPFAVLFVHGPGGVGKTALTTEMRFRCQDRDIQTFTVDARNVEPTPSAVTRAIADAGLALDDPPEGRSVLFVDTVEAWTSLFEWIRTTFFPQLPGEMLVVFAGRQPPPASWRSDLGLEPLLESVALRNLPRRHGETYLRKRGIDGVRQQQILAFAHGHPLALSLAADTVAQEDAPADSAEDPPSFDPLSAPDLLGALVQRFLERVPSDRHRQALEACALVRACTEPLLASLLAPGPASTNGVSSSGADPMTASTSDTPRAPSTHDLFAWLRTLSFIEAGPDGLFPHDIVRTAVTADLRWRDRDRFEQLQQRARSVYLDALDHATDAGTNDASSEAAEAILTDYLFLFRHNPIVQPFFQRLRDEWNAGRPPIRDTAVEEDRAPLRSLVARHEGEASAACFDHWWNHAAACTHVFRDGEDVPAGLLMEVDLSRVEEADRDADPAVDAACAYLEAEAPLRAGETACHFRFWLSRDAYQDISPVQSLISAYRVRYYLSTSGLAYTMIPVAEPDRWEVLFAYGDMHRVDAGYTVGDQAYAVFGHDWRAVPPQAWLDRLAERDLSPLLPSPDDAAPAMLVLSRGDFDDAVKEAFKSHARPDAMHGNPLLRSRLIAESVGLDASADERIDALRDRLDEAAYSLKSDPKTAKYYRAVRATYLNPQPTQERAAEHLSLAFSTYRRYLKRGLQHVADLLWREETQT